MSSTGTGTTPSATTSTIDVKSLVKSLEKYIKYINFIIIYIVTFVLICIRKYEIVGMGLLLSFNFIIQSFLLYDIFSIKDAHNSIFILSIVIGISLTILSSIFILKMLVRIQNKNNEVGNISSLIDKDLNSTYHLFSNLFITDVGLILVNAIIYFSYRFSEGDKYKNDYLYNEIGYDALDYSFLKNVYNRSKEFFTGPFEWFIVLYPLVFLFILLINTLIIIAINITKTINSLFTDFFKTLFYLFKVASLIVILTLSSILMYLSTTLSTIHLKTKPKEDDTPGSQHVPSSALNSNGIMSRVSDIFNNLNLNYLVNSKVTL
jgi:hypothetical protein